MTGDEYLQNILLKYDVQRGPQSPAECAANAIAPTIRAWAGDWLSEISYSGSYAKQTAVNTGTDVDLFVSLSADIPCSLKEMYESLYKRCTFEGWTPRRQNVSIGIKYNGMPVDLVPGRIQAGYKNWHSLYRYKSDSWIQTNVSDHISKVTSSGRLSEIKVIKIWRDLHQLAFPSFYLELLVIDALFYQRNDQLASNVLTALKYIASSIETARVVDPARTSNIISDDLSKLEKQAVARKASGSANKPTWGEIVW